MDSGGPKIMRISSKVRLGSSSLSSRPIESYQHCTDSVSAIVTWVPRALRSRWWSVLVTVPVTAAVTRSPCIIPGHNA